MDHEEVVLASASRDGLRYELYVNPPELPEHMHSGLLSPYVRVTKVADDEEPAETERRLS